MNSEVARRWGSGVSLRAGRFILVQLIFFTVACGSAKQIPVSSLRRLPPPELKLSSAPESVKFAVIGDSGTGKSPQYELGRIMRDYHALYPFDFVLMLGDNLYGSEKIQDYVRKFERPYSYLLNQGVAFYASLGNHDEPEQRHYGLFNMGGRRYYSFEKGNVAFFSLDTTLMDANQLEWIAEQLAESEAHWKICFFHHPLYSSGARHGSDEDLRSVLEPILVKHGTNVVFAGHDHFYERIKPQQGIYHFVSGAAGKIRRGNIRETQFTAVGYDAERSFLLIEIESDQLSFQAVSRTREVVDFGVLRHPGEN